MEKLVLRSVPTTQMGQLNHALWKYGKIMAHNLMCNDLDEYFHIDRTTIKKYIVNNFKSMTLSFLEIVGQRNRY